MNNKKHVISYAISGLVLILLIGIGLTVRPAVHSTKSYMDIMEKTYELEQLKNQVETRNMVVHQTRNSLLEKEQELQKIMVDKGIEDNFGLTLVGEKNEN